MNVLLIDMDSTIPNLALMKVSAWHNAKRTPRMTALKRWCRPWLFFSIEWAEYTTKNYTARENGNDGKPYAGYSVEKGETLRGDN